MKETQHRRAAGPRAADARDGHRWWLVGARDRVASGITIVATLVFLVTGLWAMLAPASFYVWVAPFPPYNRHFLHDAGAFQIGLGATLLLALRWRNALFVTLLGVGAGATLHALSHILDRDLGGRRSDPLSLGLLAALLLLAALRQWNVARKER